MNLPQSLKISSMDKLITKFNFLVTLNEFVFGFQSVSGLEINKRYDYYSEGGINDHQIMVSSPSTDNPTLTFRRGMLLHSSNAVAKSSKWLSTSYMKNNIARKAAMLAEASIDPRTALEVGPALGSIQVYNRNGKMSALYVFLSLGMTSWKAEDLDASSSDIWCEEITIAHTGLERCPLEMGIVQNFISAGVDAVSDLINPEDSHSTSNVEAQRKKNKELLEKAKKRQEELEEKKKKEQEEKQKKQEELQKQKEELQRLESEG